MSRVFSMRDLRLVPELKKYNEIQLIHPDMDKTVNKYLAQLGFDMDYAIEYVPANHRDMQGNVGVGFRAVGEISINRAFINSPLCSVTERMIAAFHTDPGLARELASLMGSSISFKDSAYDGDTEEEDFPDNLVEPTYDEVSQQIRALENIRDELRGSPYNEDGSRKLPVMED